MMRKLIEDVKVSIAIAPADGVAATTDINGAILDMSGYDGVLAIITFGEITSGAVTSIKMKQDTAAAMGGAQDLLGTGQTIADDDDEKTFYIDLLNPDERYVRLVVDRGTQTAVVASATYIQYGAKAIPTTQGSNVSGESHSRPSEGTA
jgi:hypothetical protein